MTTGIFCVLRSGQKLANCHENRYSAGSKTADSIIY